MKLISYTVDLSFSNTPSVQARVAIPDPITGKEKVESLLFVDDEARAMVAMVANPNGTGLVNHPDGLVDGAKLTTKLAARVAEMSGGTAATTLAARVAAAEAARRTAHDAQVAAAAAQAAKDKLDAEIAAAKVQKAALDAEIAAAKAKVSKP